MKLVTAPEQKYAETGLHLVHIFQSIRQPFIFQMLINLISEQNNNNYTTVQIIFFIEWQFTQAKNCQQIFDSTRCENADQIDENMNFKFMIANVASVLLQRHNLKSAHATVCVGYGEYVR